ncbi:hypothetical protein OG864_45290 [Streptomyces sp. NBC_00124]|uniref:hypothetical protein n=1 Tax=Streptomyces sp. NBC_00124 TaxID=2975662 RepID=UPI00225A4EF0|nr:hypothetical protein [Streptomyces sp. NBC_00124]MCX5365918.1 hypothetical protein [Streptomyces sp. NBC_00124]
MTTALTHRYDCTTHDGSGCDGHCAITPQLLISWYAADIAFVASDRPATTLEDFASQVGTAGSRMEDVGINNAEDLETAATYLADAVSLAGDDQAVLLKRASDLLSDVTDMVGEYRLMI